MPLIQLVIVLVVLGVFLWVVNTLIPMDAVIKKILNIVVVLVLVFWLLGLFFPGWMTWGPRVGRFM